MSKKFTAVELFAGVGGFRLGLERSGWETVWANQWEPATKIQPAADCYRTHFADQINNPYFNVDIGLVAQKLEDDNTVIPDHTLLVGGFPCQDYSVATTRAKGMLGKKGVLWWEIEKIVRHKKPPYILLENVDRLLVSPSKQRGRDMGILLGCLRDLGYGVEWRVINAADYGFPQKRRRVFIFAFLLTSKVGIKYLANKSPHLWLQKLGFFASEFEVEHEPVDHDIEDNFSQSVQDLSDKFSFKFHNSGIMFDKKIYTLKLKSKHAEIKPLSDVLLNNVDKTFYVNKVDIEKQKGWKYVKGSKREKRTASNGHIYHYAEGAIPFPDNLASPSRTILTNEGNQNPNRSTHLVEDIINGGYRTLTPVEVERLNGFPDNWTNTGMTQSKRYFCMGNALVVGVIERLTTRLKEIV